jgi:sugar/nucleoside kinase (ribokinase family)
VISIIAVNVLNFLAIEHRKFLKQKYISNGWKAIEKLKEIVPVVAIKKGEYGAKVYANGNIYEVNAPSIDVVDTVGAGDSFDGGFIYGLLNGKSIEECVKIACICGSLNTRYAGGVKGQPNIHELEEWLSK